MGNERFSGRSVTIGVVADLQYCDAPPFKNRYYRHSIRKLKKAIATFNKLRPDFVINLGDAIDRNMKSFHEILPVFHGFKMPVYHVLGNHDYEVDEEVKSSVHEVLGTEKCYEFSKNGWRFIVLDGNEISTFANIERSENYLKAKAMLDQIEREGKVNANFWNGALSGKQLQWLDKKLVKSHENHEKVIIFCHYPIYPANRHNLLNDTEVLELLKSHSCVKAWICGHDHDGNYGMMHDIHFVNMRGMVEGALTERERERERKETGEGESSLAYSIFRLENDAIFIQGFGREISARLSIR